MQHLGFVPSGGAGDHGSLAAHFRLRGMPALAVSLRDLRRWRNECDYDNVVPTLSTTVGEALREAAAVIQRL
jgi:hypothetical protein